MARGADDIDALCEQAEPIAREAWRDAWSDPDFVASYARWATGIFEGQRHDQRSVMIRERALRRRVHTLTVWLFALTAAGALAHLLLHARGLLIATTFFPALGAALHGAVAQSESYRLAIAAERMQPELTRAIRQVEEALLATDRSSVPSLKATLQTALSLLLEEHRDWHMLVRPHKLSLA